MVTDLENPQQDVEQPSSAQQDDLAENAQDDSDKNGSPATVEQILGVKMPIIVRVAEKTMNIEEVLKISIGSIISFDKDAYQHIELMVNNSVIGLGQPVKIAENFGLRVTQIGELAETIKSLGNKSES